MNLIVSQQLYVILHKIFIIKPRQLSEIPDVGIIHTICPYCSGFLGVISRGGPGSPSSSGNISTHICSLPCSIPGWAGWYSGRVSTCSGTKSNLVSRCKANLSRTSPNCADASLWSFSVSGSNISLIMTNLTSLCFVEIIWKAPRHMITMPMETPNEMVMVRTIQWNLHWCVKSTCYT